MPFLAAWGLGKLRGVGLNVLFGAIGVVGVILALWLSVGAISRAAKRANDAAWQSSLSDASEQATRANAAAAERGAAAAAAERAKADAVERAERAHQRATDLEQQIATVKAQCADPVLYPADRRAK